MQEEGGCDFFVWMDDGLTGRAKEAFYELNQKKVLIEEKLKIAEEKLKIVEEKLKIVEDKVGRKAMKKKKRNRKKQANFIKSCVMVTIIVLLVVFCNHKMVEFSDKKYLI